MRCAVTDGVDVESGALQTDLVEKRHEHLDDFGIDGRGIAATEDFGADLVELVVTAFLGALPAEHGAYVVELYGLRELLQVVFDRGAANRGRSFRTETDGSLVAIFKRIHLFRDNIRVETDGPRE